MIPHCTLLFYISSSLLSASEQLAIWLYVAYLTSPSSLKFTNEQLIIPLFWLMLSFFGCVCKWAVNTTLHSVLWYSFFTCFSKWTINYATLHSILRYAFFTYLQMCNFNTSLFLMLQFSFFTFVCNWATDKTNCTLEFIVFLPHPCL